MLTTAESEVSMVVWIYDCYRAVVCHQCVADHAALSQAKKIRRSRSRPYSEHGNLAGRGLWWPLISPQAGRPELATETPEKPQSYGNMGGRQPAVIAGYLGFITPDVHELVHHYQDRPRPSKTEKLLGCRSNQWTLAR